MSGSAKSTYIPDGTSASDSLAAMAARSELMGERITQITNRIGGLEANKPWGRAPEYGGQFERVYDAGDGGADYVRKQAHILAEQTRDGVTKAHQALQGSLELDREGAGLFRVVDSSTVGGRMNGIGSARDGEIGRQSDGG
jgi:hypothetical protein